jgi:hypothetical protein
MFKIPKNPDIKVKFESAKSWFFSPLDLKIYIILSLISLILLFYSIWEIKPVIVDVKDFLGLTSHLTLPYWIGYILILFCSIRLYLDKEIRSDSIYLLIIIIIGLFLFGVSIFSEENARFQWSYYPAGEVKTVLETKYIDSISEYNLLSYRSWPATHLISASIIYFANVNLDSIIKYMPLFWMITLIFICMSIKRSFSFSPKQSFLFTFMIINSFVLFLYYYGPQSIAYLIFILIFILLGNENIDHKQNRLILLILLFLMLVTTHLLTSLIIVIVVSIKSLYKRRFKIAFLFIAIFVAWYIYLAPFMFKVGIKEFVKQSATPETASFLATNKILQASTILSHTYLGIYVICVLFITFNVLYNKTLLKNNKLIECIIWLIGIASLFLFSYGAEIDDRLYIFSIIPAAAYIILGMPSKKMLIVVMLTFSILHIPTHYDPESLDMVYTTELHGSKFFALKISPEYAARRYEFNPVTISYHYGPLIRYYNPSLANIWSSGYTSGLYYPSNSTLEDSTYILYSKQINNYLIYLFGTDAVEKWLRKDNRRNLIYNNNYYFIYK